MLTDKILKGVLHDKLSVTVDHTQEEEYEVDLNAMLKNNNSRI